MFWNLCIPPEGAQRHTNGCWSVWRARGQHTHAAAIEPGHLHLCLQAICRMAGGPEALEISVTVKHEQDPHMRVLIQPLQASHRYIRSGVTRTRMSSAETPPMFLRWACKQRVQKQKTLPPTTEHLGCLHDIKCCSIMSEVEIMNLHECSVSVQTYRSTSFARALHASSGWRGVPFRCEKQDCK